MAPVDTCPGAHDPTTTSRLIDLCTRRRLAWLDERRMWARVSFLLDGPSTEVLAETITGWQAAAATVRGLDSAIELEAVAWRMDQADRDVDEEADEPARCDIYRAQEGGGYR